MFPLEGVLGVVDLLLIMCVSSSLIFFHSLWVNIHTASNHWLLFISAVFHSVSIVLFPSPHPQPLAADACPSLILVLLRFKVVKTQIFLLADAKCSLIGGHLIVWGVFSRYCRVFWCCRASPLFNDCCSHRWPPSVLSQTICLPCPKCEHHHPWQSVICLLGAHLQLSVVPLCHAFMEAGFSNPEVLLFKLSRLLH